MEAMTEPLTESEVRALDEGTPIIVTWSGGNGPHRYIFTKDEHGEPYAWAKDLSDPNGVLRFYNPLTFVGQERFHTRVWLPETPDLPTTDNEATR